MAARMDWTADREEAFLKALRACGGSLVHASAAVAPHSESKSQPGYTSVKSHMRSSPAFALRVEEVLEEVRSDIYAEIWSRAMHGTLEPVYQKGERVRDFNGEPASIRRLDNKLLLRLAGKLDPGWQESRKLEVEHKVTGSTVRIETADLVALSDSQRGQLMDILGTIQNHRTGETQPALEHRPSQVVDAEFEEVPSQPELHPWEMED